MTFPVIVPPVHLTPNGVHYLRDPGLQLIGKPEVVDYPGANFIDQFDLELGFDDYHKDPTPMKTLPPAARLIKFAGQLCYMSFDRNRTKNADARKYITHILESGHGSVCEHAQFSFLFWGIDRSVTHELVRHRAGFGFSQVSQRYVDGKKLRFVERPEFQNDDHLHLQFVNWVEQAKREYDNRAGRLAEIMGPTFPDGMSKVERRKRVNQAARSSLPNEAEAPIVVSANVRSWRHFIEMRAATLAEVQIRRLAFDVYLILNEVEPGFFADYKVIELPDGTKAVDTKYRKI